MLHVPSWRTHGSVWCTYARTLRELLLLFSGCLPSTVLLCCPFRLSSGARACVCVCVCACVRVVGCWCAEYVTQRDAVGTFPSFGGASNPNPIVLRGEETLTPATHRLAK